jgi:transcription elongation factor GreA
MDTIYVTAKGKKILENRLAELIASREQAAEDIREAREFGDLKENAEYAAAREFQANLETEINLVQDRLNNLKLFSYAKADTSKVCIGCKVKIQEVGGKKAQEWTITGVIENDPSNFYISNEAPLGKNLLNKAVGDIVEVQTPSGAIKYKVIEINRGE